MIARPFPRRFSPASVTAAYWSTGVLSLLYPWNFLLPIFGHPVYRDFVPNGHYFKAVGHTGDPNEGYTARSSFGSDFSRYGKSWTEALCKLDSDGDGFSNGEELGDPDCKWSKSGGKPVCTTKVSDPGDSEKAAACGNGSGEEDSTMKMQHLFLTTHGIMMLVAWGMMIPMGIWLSIKSRNKQGFLNIKGCNTKEDSKWWHKRIAPAGFLLSIIGLTFSILSGSKVGSYHSIVGIMATAVASLQVFLPWGASWFKKPILFRWHRLYTGYVAQMLAMLACVTGGWMYFIRFSDQNMFGFAMVICLFWQYVLFHNMFDRIINNMLGAEKQRVMWVEDDTSSIGDGDVGNIRNGHGDNYSDSSNSQTIGRIGFR